MKIYEPQLLFDSGCFIPRPKTDKILVKDAGIRTCTIHDLHRQAINSGFAGFGYHYFVSAKGQIFRGRDADIAGFDDATAVSVCFEGNARDKSYVMPKTQREAIQTLIYDIVNRYPTIKAIDTPEIGVKFEIKPKKEVKANENKGRKKGRQAPGDASSIGEH